MNYKNLTINYFGEKLEVQLSIELYNVESGLTQESLYGLAIQLYSKTIIDGEELMEPFAMLTKSFGEFISIKNAAYIDINNCPFSAELLSLNIAKDTGLSINSGFCSYPLWQFNEEFLKDIGEENYELYSTEFDKHMQLFSPDVNENEYEENDELTAIKNILQ